MAEHNGFVYGRFWARVGPKFYYQVPLWWIRFPSKRRTQYPRKEVENSATKIFRKFCAPKLLWHFAEPEFAMAVLCEAVWVCVSLQRTTVKKPPDDSFIIPLCRIFGWNLQFLCQFMVFGWKSIFIILPPLHRCTLEESIFYSGPAIQGFVRRVSLVAQTVTHSVSYNKGKNHNRCNTFATENDSRILFQRSVVKLGS